MYKTRTRMVSFRLSEDEYERLKDLSLTERARSVSDFARSALCRLPKAHGGPDPAHVERLEGAVRQLKVDVNELRRLVDSLITRDARSATAEASQ